VGEVETIEKLEKDLLEGLSLTHTTQKIIFNYNPEVK
jgi:hypothetical protein